MSLESAHNYHEQSERLIALITSSLPDSSEAILFGSVAGEFLPNDDIDLLLLSEPTMDNPRDIQGVPVQYTDLTPTMYGNYLMTTRGSLIAIQGIALNLTQQSLQALELRKACLYAGDRTALITALLAEQEADENRHDIANVRSYYSAKRVSGSKRSCTRALILASLLSGEVHDTDSVEEMYHKLIDARLLDEEVLTNMFIVNALLAQWRKTRTRPVAWNSNLPLTKEWVGSINKLACSHVIDSSESDILNNLSIAKGPDTMAIDELTDDIGKNTWSSLIETALLYMLASNPLTSCLSLERMWKLCEDDDSDRSELASLIVQHQNFTNVDATSVLLKNQTVARAYSLRVNKGQLT